ncbi:GntR family transcriptional regulator, partial [Rahnella victoriana]
MKKSRGTSNKATSAANKAINSADSHDDVSERIRMTLAAAIGEGA